MTDSRERRWLRPLGLVLVAMAIAIGQPLVVVAATFATLTLFFPRGRLSAFAFAAIAFGLAFSGPPGDGLWYLERGWAMIVGGCFAAATLVFPDRPFLPRALAALAGAAVAAGALLLAFDGWGVVEWIVVSRLQAGAASTLQLVGLTLGMEAQAAVQETIDRTVEAQVALFPALVALGTLCALGVAWWLHLRLARGSDEGLGSLREFRFPDPMVWLLIGGLVLVLLTDWNAGWGIVGTNLLAFMAALYTVRGAGVLLFLSGGLSFGWGILLAVGMILAGPVLLGGAVVVGLGDSWLDLRARVGRGRDERKN